MTLAKRDGELLPGPVAFDPAGPELSPEEREALAHPLVGGVILFRHNYLSRAQVRELIADCRRSRAGPLLVFVDHEGGRVQRFREGFTALPPARELGRQYLLDPARALADARAVGRVMASELCEVGVDVNLAPVVDLVGPGTVIGDRAFAQDPVVVSALARSVVTGMHDGGLGAVAKHFPGHGGVAEDTHTETACDQRSLSELAECDLKPFEELIALGVDGVLPAHVCFPQVDEKPVGFSPHWLQHQLRRRLNFDGLVVSDDISMAAASLVGGVVASAEAAIGAGCDFVLSCQKPAAVAELLDGLTATGDQVGRARRMENMHTSLQERRIEFDIDFAIGRATALVRKETAGELRA